MSAGLTVKIGETRRDEELVLDGSLRASVDYFHVVHDFVVEILTFISHCCNVVYKSTHNMIIGPLGSQQPVPIEHGLNRRSGLLLAFIRTHDYWINVKIHW